MEQLDGTPPTAADLRALAFAGLGHFTTVRVESGGVRGLGQHLDRLADDSRALFDTELDLDLVRARIRSAIADEPAVVLVRVTVFDPALTLERPGADAAPRILISPRPASTGVLPPLRLRSVRFGRQTPEIKHTGLFGAVRERRLAQRAGFDDALFSDDAGRISEGPTWNIGFVRDGEVVWAAGEALPGITRALLDGRSETVELAHLPRLDAAFVTSSGVGIRPVAAIDDRAFPTDHPRFGDLRTAYAAVALERI